ncbi:hypothetical protein D9M71_84930 [compost metagenome]
MHGQGHRIVGKAAPVEYHFIAGNEIRKVDSHRQGRICWPQVAQLDKALGIQRLDHWPRQQEGTDLDKGVAGQRGAIGLVADFVLQQVKHQQFFAIPGFLDCLEAHQQGNRPADLTLAHLMRDLDPTPTEDDRVADFHVTPWVDMHRDSVLGDIPVDQSRRQDRKHQPGMVWTARVGIGPAWQGPFDLDLQPRRSPGVVTHGGDHEPDVMNAIGDSALRHVNEQQLIDFLRFYHIGQRGHRGLLITTIDMDLVPCRHVQVRLHQRLQPFGIGVQCPGADPAIDPIGMVKKHFHVRNAQVRVFQGTDLIDPHEPGPRVGSGRPAVQGGQVVEVQGLGEPGPTSDLRQMKGQRHCFGDRIDHIEDTVTCYCIQGQGHDLPAVPQDLRTATELDLYVGCLGQPLGIETHPVGRAAVGQRPTRCARPHGLPVLALLVEREHIAEAYRYMPGRRAVEVAADQHRFGKRIAQPDHLFALGIQLHGHRLAVIGKARRAVDRHLPGGTWAPHQGQRTGQRVQRPIAGQS